MSEQNTIALLAYFKDFTATNLSIGFCHKCDEQTIICPNNFSLSMIKQNIFSDHAPSSIDSLDVCIFCLEKYIKDQG